jgi:midasin (ATPase involved in ribosome maturation)
VDELSLAEDSVLERLNSVGGPVPRPNRWVKK